MIILNAFIIYLVLGAVSPSKSLYKALCNGDVPQTASWDYQCLITDLSKHLLKCATTTTKVQENFVILGEKWGQFVYVWVDI